MPETLPTGTVSAPGIAEQHRPHLALQAPATHAHSPYQQPTPRIYTFVRTSVAAAIQPSATDEPIWPFTPSLLSPAF